MGRDPIADGGQVAQAGEYRTRTFLDKGLPIKAPADWLDMFLVELEKIVYRHAVGLVFGQRGNGIGGGMNDKLVRRFLVGVDVAVVGKSAVAHDLGASGVGVDSVS